MRQSGWLSITAMTMIVLVVACGVSQAARTSRLPLSDEKLDGFAQAPLPTPGQAGPVHTSALEVFGKVSLVVLLLYGVAFVMARTKNGRSPLTRWLPKVALPGTPQGQSLKVHETLALSPQEGTLYLVEVEGQKLLIGASANHCELLWSAATEATSSFKPVETELPTPRMTLISERNQFSEETPLYQRGFGKPQKRESEWARERSRLINALMQPE